MDRREMVSRDKGSLNRMLFCADCGGRIYYKIPKSKTHMGSYFCATHDKFQKICSEHNIPRDILEKGVLDNLNKVISYARKDESRFLALVRGKGMGPLQEERTQKDQDLRKVQNRIKEIDKIIKKLFEQNVAGVLSAERFETMMADYEKEERDLKVREDQLKKLAEEMGEDHDTKRFLELVKRYTEIKELTPEIANLFIQKILIHEPEGRTRWDRTYRVEVVYNFIGSVDIVEEDENVTEKIMGYPAIIEYFKKHRDINNQTVCDLTGMRRDQATFYIHRLVREGILRYIQQKKGQNCYRLIERDEDGNLRLKTTEEIVGDEKIYGYLKENGRINGMIVRALTTMTVQESKDYLKDLCLDGVLVKDPDEKRYAEYRLVG